jgi:hypothetical protein
MDLDLDRTNAIIGVVTGLLALAGLAAGYVKVARPRWLRLRSRAVGALDALVGRDAVHDSITGREIAPALPGIGTRMETVERAVAHIAELLDSQRSQDQEIANLRADFGRLDARVSALEGGAIERVATKAESVAAFRAIEAVAKQADPTAPELEEPQP